MSEQGQVEIHFVERVRRQIRLLGIEAGWDLAGLANWLDRQIPHPDSVRTESALFIYRVLAGLIESGSVTVEQLAAQKFRLRGAIAATIAGHRSEQAKRAFQQVLFQDQAGNIRVSPDFSFSFAEELYSPNWEYEGAYRIRKALFPIVGSRILEKMRKKGQSPVVV